MTADKLAVLNQLPCGWLSMDRHGVLLAVNATLCRMLGVQAEHLLGKTFDSLLTRPARVLYQSYLQPLLHLHGNVEEFSVAFDLGAGQVLDALVYSATAQPVAGQAEPTRPIELVLASVRKRRGIEDEMLRIKRAADHAPGMIFQLMQLADGSCHFPYTSEAIRRMYGVTSQQASESAERLFGFLSVETRADLCGSLRDSARADHDWHAVFEVTLPGASVRWHEAHATPRRLAHGVTLWHGHCADVTDRRALESAVADRAALEYMHRTHSEFLARVSHELRTPLNGILGFAQLMSTDRAENLRQDQRERLALLGLSGRHLLALVNDVLEITSIEAGQLRVDLQPLELRPLLERALQAAEGQATAAQVVVLPLHCPHGLWLRSHEQRLQQVLANLLSNAIKYNTASGTVQLTAHREEGHLRITVADSGKGMSREQTASLFQPFNRLGAQNTAVAGHGLGLVISKHLVELMGGSLQVNSQPGQGSSFSIVMPLESDLVDAQVEPPQATDRLAAESPTPTLHSLQLEARVLYVEDDEVNGILMAAVLGMRPQISLHTAVSGAQAMEAVQRARFDLLLIDMHLPDTSGIELLAALRKTDGLQSTPAIMVSAGARQKDIDRAHACGFAGYWTKPLDVNKVVAELDDLLHKAAAARLPKAL